MEQVVGTIGTAPEAVGTGYRGPDTPSAASEGVLPSMVAAARPNREVRDRLASKHFPHILDLDDFPDWHLSRIMAEVEQDEKPHRYRYFGDPSDLRPMARIESRGWLEWHLFRGMDPYRRAGILTEVRRAVIYRDGYTCGICGGNVDPTDVHLDHVIPYSRGGPTTVENLRVTHSICNIRRGNRADGA